MPNSLKSLLPCPFCGGEASISSVMDESIWSHNIVPWTSVACTLCDVQIPPICEGSENDPIAAWNTRAPIAEGGAYAESIGEIETLFHKCVSALVSADYANGYLEAIRHIKDRAAEKAQLSTPAAIESLSRQGGDMSKNPENLDTSAERVYGIDTSQVEYDRELIAKMLDESADVADCEIGFYSADTLREQAALLRAADNRAAAGLDGTMRMAKDDSGTWLKAADIESTLAAADGG